METHIQGYPVEVFYIAALIGVILVIFRPKWAFLFIVVCLAMRHHEMAVFTRTPLLKEYMNLNDLLLWIGVGAMVRICLKDREIWAPNILLAIFAILIAGDFQILFQYGFNYIEIRALWASWIFPIMFLVAANLVRDTEEARQFAWALFLGAVFGAIHHLLFVYGEVLTSLILISQSNIRSVAFMYSGGLFLVLGVLFIDIQKILQKFYYFILWSVGLSLVGISYVLSFTRTIWAGAILSAIALFCLLYREQKGSVRRLAYAIPFIILTIIMFNLTSRYLLPGVEVVNFLEKRADFVTQDDAFENAYATREQGIQTELNLWENSLIIWGVGSSYGPRIDKASVDVHVMGALNHVAFSSYLAHFGLIGLITYAIFLPILTILIAKRYYAFHKYDYGAIIATTSISLALFNIFTMVSGFHYLIPPVHVQGLIYGAIWGLSRSLPQNKIRLLAPRILAPRV